jgi:hypothetical protein
MSLVTVYHSPSRAVIAADGRSTYEDGTGARHRAAGVWPKFCVLGSMIFICTGRTALTQRLFRGAQRMMADYPATGFADLAGFLPFALRQTWTKRPPAQISDALDSLAGGLLGFDGEKLRCFWWFSRRNFELLETTRDPNSRIAVDGFFEDSDTEYLQAFTHSMARGESERPEWIAQELRRAIGELSRRHPDTIDPAAHFALLDRSGARELSPEFPLPSFGQERAAPASVNATINVASFTMRVPGMTDISENSGAITGLSYNTLYYVYHDDPGFIGGAVTYHATTTKATALNSAGRFFDGSIVTPQAGAPDTVGNNDGGAGAQMGVTTVLNFSTATIHSVSGTGSITNPQYAIDGDPSTYAAIDFTGNGINGNYAELDLAAPAGVTQRYSSANLVIDVEVPTNGVTPSDAGYVMAWFELRSRDPYVYSPTTNLGNFYFVHPGYTQARQLITLALPLGLNLSQLFLEFYTMVTSTQASGSCEVRIHDARIEAIQ